MFDLAKKIQLRQSILLLACLILALLFACKKDIPTESTNHPPDQPYSPYPTSGAVDVVTSPQLIWQCSDPDDDLMLYDVYYGTDDPPDLVAENWPNKHYLIETPLNRDVTYYWKIAAIDFSGARTAGPVWNFHTSMNRGLYLVGTCDNAGNALKVFVIYEQAYIAAAEEGLEIFDVVNPAAPVWMSNYTFYETNTLDVCVEGNYAYVADANYGLRIIDIGSNIYNPTLRALVLLPSYARAVTIRDDIAFVACNLGGLQIVDVEHVDYASIVGSFSTLDAEALDVSIWDNYALLACGTRGLYIIDISNFSQPELVSVYDTPGMVNAAQPFVRNGLNMAYIADGSEGFKLIDFTDAANPSLVHEHPLSGTVHDIYYDGYYVYIAGGSYGLAIREESDLLTDVARYEIDEPARNIFVDGDYIYIGYGYEGTAILKFQK